jgi:hypothetical protein
MPPPSQYAGEDAGILDRLKCGDRQVALLALPIGRRNLHQPVRMGDGHAGEDERIGQRENG